MGAMHHQQIAVTVTIGRNHKDTNEPMPKRDWKEFEHRVLGAMDYAGRITVALPNMFKPEFTEVHKGTSSAWDGVTEDSKKITRIYNVNFMNPWVSQPLAIAQYTTGLSDALTDLCTEFGQDAIALTVAPVMLITD